MLIKLMTELIPFTIEGPVKFFKVLNFEEKRELLKRRMIEPTDLDARIMAFYDSEKRVIGYDIESFNK